MNWGESGRGPNEEPNTHFGREQTGIGASHLEGMTMVDQVRLRGIVVENEN